MEVVLTAVIRQALNAIRATVVNPIVATRRRVVKSLEMVLAQLTR